MVTQHKFGRERRFVACPIGIVTAQAALAAISQQWDGILTRLKTHVEKKS